MQMSNVPNISHYHCENILPFETTFKPGCVQSHLGYFEAVPAFDKSPYTLYSHCTALNVT